MLENFNEIGGYMKIAICTILKNEIDYLPNYLERNKDVDYICLLDTGSTDGTWEYLQEQSLINPKLIIQQKIYEDFRFDTVRNDSFKLLPEDINIVIPLDLDEYFYQTNWVSIIKDKVEIDNVGHLYIIPYLENSEYQLGDSKFLYSIPKIVQTKDFIWKYCVHEEIHYIGDKPKSNNWEYFVNLEDVLIVHQPDKSKDRSKYIDLCLKRCEESLEGDDKLFSYLYLFYEYYVNNKYEEALKLYYDKFANNELFTFCCSSYVYKITNNINFLRLGMSLLATYGYDPNLLYCALTEDFENCKRYKDIILENIFEHENQIYDKFLELDEVGNQIKQLTQQL